MRGTKEKVTKLLLVVRVTTKNGHLLVLETRGKEKLEIVRNSVSRN